MLYFPTASESFSDSPSSAVVFFLTLIPQDKLGVSPGKQVRQVWEMLVQMQLAFLLAESQGANVYFECIKGIQNNMLHFPNLTVVHTVKKKKYTCSVLEQSNLFTFNHKVKSIHLDMEPQHFLKFIQPQPIFVVSSLALTILTWSSSWGGSYVFQASMASPICWKSPYYS